MEVVSGWYLPCCKYILKQWDNVTQKDDFNSFIPATITQFSGAKSVRVSKRWIAKDIQNLIIQSERAFKAIHCSIMY